MNLNQVLMMLNWHERNILEMACPHNFFAPIRDLSRDHLHNGDEVGDFKCATCHKDITQDVLEARRNEG